MGSNFGAGGGGGGGVPDSCPMLLGASTVAPGLNAPVFNNEVPGMNTSHGTGAPFLSPAASMDHLQLFRAPAYANPLDAVAAHGHGTSRAPMASLADKCFDSFYYHYHAAHPFVLPKQALIRHRQETGQKLDHLVTAMKYVGSLFLDAGPVRASYLDEALRLCHSPTTPKDGFLVQALLLLIVALDGSCEQDKARDLLGEAERVAIEIELNTRQFATLHGRGNPVLEESWRRTWWDLYVCDGMIAGVHRVTNFLLHDIASDVGLPCEEAEYLSGVSRTIFRP